MPRLLDRIANLSRVTGTDYNRLADAINRMIPRYERGRVIEMTRGTALETQEVESIGKPINPELQMAKVLSNATGGGYYNCQFQQLKSGVWDTTTAGQFDDLQSTVLIMPAKVTFAHNEDSNDTITYTGESGPTTGFITNGLRRGMQVAITGASDPTNNTTITINNLTETIITCDPTDVLVDEVDTIGIVQLVGTLKVLNLPEVPVAAETDAHNLTADDLILCWYHIDADGSTRVVGIDAARLTEC
jgi:hypothetical protein